MCAAFIIAYLFVCMYVYMYVCINREDSEVGGVNSTGQASDADSGKELNGFFNSEFFGKFLNTCQAVSQRSCPSTGTQIRFFICMYVMFFRYCNSKTFALIFYVQ